MGRLFVIIKCPYQGSRVRGRRCLASVDRSVYLSACHPLSSEGTEVGPETSRSVHPSNRSGHCKHAALFRPPAEAHVSFSLIPTAFQDVKLGFLQGVSQLLFHSGISLGIFPFKKRKCPTTEKQQPKLRHCCCFLSVCERVWVCVRGSL